MHLLRSCQGGFDYNKAVASAQADRDQAVKDAKTSQLYQSTVKRL
ncbi:hypothetical protein [Weissella cibaria]|nr:hypothetical protein [Weissella cibaria]